MFITMNRFRVRSGSAADVETVWLTRDLDVAKEKGFTAFHLLRGPEQEDHTLYASHTVWASREDFIAWAWSRNQVYRDVSRSKPLCIGGPAFEYFSVIQTVTP